jgi:hypothetical protein
MSSAATGRVATAARLRPTSDAPRSNSSAKLRLPGHCQVSRREESHLPPLSGPDVTVSCHPAPTVRPAVNATRCQWAKRAGWWR